MGWPAFIYWTVALILAYVPDRGFYVLQARRREVGRPDPALLGILAIAQEARRVEFGFLRDSPAT